MIDEELLDRYLEYSGRMARAGILDCGAWDEAMASGKSVEQYMCEALERDAQMTPINDWSEVPEFASESEEQDYWSTHRMGDALLEQFEPVPVEGDDWLPPARERR